MRLLAMDCVKSLLYLCPICAPTLPDKKFKYVKLEFLSSSSASGWTFVIVSFESLSFTYFYLLICFSTGHFGCSFTGPCVEIFVLTLVVFYSISAGPLMLSSVQPPHFSELIHFRPKFVSKFAATWRSYGQRRSGSFLRHRVDCSSGIVMRFWVTVYGSFAQNVGSCMHDLFRFVVYLLSWTCVYMFLCV